MTLERIAKNKQIIRTVFEYHQNQLASEDQRSFHFVANLQRRFRTIHIR